jgi:hypothetical protein
VKGSSLGVLTEDLMPKSQARPDDIYNTDFWPKVGRETSHFAAVKDISVIIVGVFIFSV